ncbi:MAG: penicillin-binding protein activator LpoB [Bacteroidales bacterium]|nr:penicillin-binding protein activator LpoB [Bacteroidales bacterium]
MKKIFSVVLLLAVAFASFGQDRTLKRKVAIGRFSNETTYAKGIFYDKENDPMRKQALDILSSKLALSEKFILLEREDLDILVAESGANMQKIGADFIILGSITEFGRKTEGQRKVFSNIKTQTVEAGVSIRLVDASTGLIIYSDEAKGFAETTSKQTLGLGGTADYDATLSDKAISAALSQLVENIVRKCMDVPWRSYLLSAEGSGFFISGGQSQGLKVGDVFPVYKKGKTVVNPQNGMKVELPGEKVGEVTIAAFYGNTPESEISFASYRGTQIDANDFSQYYISEK